MGAGKSCSQAAHGEQSGQSLRQAAQALQDGQRQLAQAGEGQQPGSSPGQGGKGGNQGAGGQSTGAGGMGGPGIGNGGRVGAQQPLNSGGRESMVRGQQDPKGPRASSTYREQPDVNPSRAAAYVTTPAFRRKTEAALNREEVPASHRRQVKEYFDSLRGR